MQTLTERELTVLARMAKDHSNQALVSKLYLSGKTVEELRRKRIRQSWACQPPPKSTGESSMS